MKLRILPLILAAVLLAAHFLRRNDLILMALSLAAPFLLLIKRRWSLRLVQFLTLPAAAIWLLTLNGIIQQRIFEQRSWMASAIILGTVTAITLLAGWLLNAPQVREHYPER